MQLRSTSRADGSDTLFLKISSSLGLGPDRQSADAPNEETITTVSMLKFDSFSARVLGVGTPCLFAGIAQLVEPMFCNHSVGGSNPSVGSETRGRFLAEDVLFIISRKPQTREIRVGAALG